ncbi:hypothetical protein NIES4073_02790 (plasmid) [Kalymmatonema gypsitolerans NIES-4073]|nr:hypothetical protein NIES4073_02790 [Scytonema sp. NIES-4073]
MLNLIYTSLGKQAPDYKATKKALLNFITELEKVRKATNFYLANPKAKHGFFEFANKVIVLPIFELFCEIA